MVPFVTFQPSLSFPLGLLAFYVVIIGGMGRIAGALYGGLLVAVAESVGAVILSPSLKQLFSFGLFVLILLLRPEGLLGRRTA